ncbi:MAG: cryptochrome/photolyase family protein, partial [Rubricella sp.]
ADNQALTAAVEAGGPVIPVFILDPETESLGAAPRWRLEQSLRSLAAALENKGSRLVLRRGKAPDVLEALCEEAGAKAVHWTRLYAPDTKERDSAVKSVLKDAGVAANSHPGHVLHEPWTVETKDGGFYKVYSPYWRAVKDREIGEPLSAPSSIPAPTHWPKSDTLDDWALGRGMQRGAEIVARHAVVGEEAARGRLGAFVANRIDGYRKDRDFLDREGTSRLSENLTWGEISIRTCWHAGMRAHQEGKAGAEHFVKELVWRDFAWHLIHHTPEIVSGNWRPEWDSFPWRQDNDDAEAWRRGMTGEPLVDAAMREMYVTGTMHNRSRMVVASYLTKHLMTHWKVGMDWFAECLIDHDPASNAMGWQWTAGSGPDAAPYFRIYNPETQAEKHDPSGAYRARFLHDSSGKPSHPDAESYFDAVPESWDLTPDTPYPDRIVDLKAGRERALAAYEENK